MVQRGLKDHLNLDLSVFIFNRDVYNNYLLKCSPRSYCEVIIHTYRSLNLPPS